MPGKIMSGMHEGDDETDRFDSGLRRKLRAFYEQTEYFRKRVPYTPIHDLLAEIIEKTGYGIWITAMPGGAQRAANVEMLSEKAAAFEGTSYKGLFNFVRYIEQLKKYDVDYGEAGILDEQSDTVRIMSIHKSKGLEFPVVFAAGKGKRFNTQDTKGSMILHPEWGVGLDDIDIERRTKKPTFLKKMIQKEALLETLAEEQRILYVALTRAKEKLIMTGCTDRTVIEAAAEGGGVFLAADARSYLDWVLPSVFAEDGKVVKTVRAMVRRMSSAGRGLRPSMPVPGMAIRALMGMDSMPRLCRVKAMSSRSCQVSPMPMMPPEQTHIPSAWAALMVRIRSSKVWLVQIWGKYRREVSMLWW